VTGVEAKAKAIGLQGQGQGDDFLSSSRPRGSHSCMPVVLFSVALLG